MVEKRGPPRGIFLFECQYFKFNINPILRLHLHLLSSCTFYLIKCIHILGFLGGASGKEPPCECKRCQRCEFHPWILKILWRREWRPTPVFLPGDSHGQRRLAGFSPWHGRVASHSIITGFFIFHLNCGLHLERHGGGCYTY